MQMIINLIDKNDNAPVFDKAVYNFNHMDTTGPHTPLGTVSATDADDGANGIITYSIIEGDEDGESMS